MNMNELLMGTLTGFLILVSVLLADDTVGRYA